MIRFFRKTREKFLAEDRLLKYLKYAFGEVLLIVLGLLLAIQINNWNEDRKQQIQVSQYLGDLILDIEEDQESREFLFEVSLFRFHSLQYLLKISGHKPFNTERAANAEAYVPTLIWKDPIPESYNESFVRKTLIWSQRLMDQKLNAKTMKEMEGLGLFSAIQNKDLREEISAYYASNEFLLGEGHQAKHARIVERWNSSFENDGTHLGGVELDDSLTFLKGNKKRIGIMYTMMREASFVAGVSGAYNKRSERLIEKIEAEINK